MSDNLSTNCSLLTLCLSKEDFFISAYPSKLVFGEVDNYLYKNNKSFVIYKKEFIEFFCGIRNLMKALKSTKKEKGILLKKVDLVYFWEKLEAQDIFLFGIERNSEIVYKTDFDLVHLNCFFHCFQKLLFSCLLLRDFEVDVINKISILPMKKILELKQNEHVLLQTLKECSEGPNFVNLRILVQNNIDIIIIIHKLGLLINQNVYEANFSELIDLK